MRRSGFERGEGIVNGDGPEARGNESLVGFTTISDEKERINLAG